MQNVYLDPNSYVHLNNGVFARNDAHNVNNCREPFIFLKQYCFSNGVNLNTIDLAPADTSQDIYVSFDHKFFLRKRYWKLKNKNYPIVNPDKFRKKILFQFEPPIVMPEMQYIAERTVNMYDKAFFTWKVKGEKARYFHTAQAHEGIFSAHWERRDRKFLTLINSNRSSLSRYKELLTERVRSILFFAKTGDIDLYGFGWDKQPLFPYWFAKNAIQKVYKGSVKDKYETLSNYTFAVAFENCELPGYITDKIFDCFFAGTIPLYRGAADIGEYIPKDCFIDTRDFKNYEELRKYLKSLSPEEISKYKENGRRFIESAQYKQFCKEHFAKTFLEACLN